MKIALLLDEDVWRLKSGLANQADSDAYDDGWRRTAERVVLALGTAQNVTEPAKDADAPGLEVLGEVKPGGSYLLRLTEPAAPQAAMRAREQLERTFPGTTFGILSHNLETVTPGVDLVGALAVAARKLHQQFLNARDDSTRQVSYAGAVALDTLRVALQTGDGAAPPPADPPTKGAATPGEQADESATGDEAPEPAPSPSEVCGERHPRLLLACDRIANHDMGFHRSDTFGVWWE
jgi:hypothetical protein